MNKIVRTKRACHDRRDPTTVGCLNSDVITDMNENLLVAQSNEGKLAEIGVCRKVFESMKLRMIYQCLISHSEEIENLNGNVQLDQGA